MPTGIYTNSGEDISKIFHAKNDGTPGSCGDSNTVTISASKSEQSFQVPRIKKNDQGHIISYSLTTIKITTGIK